MSPPSVPAAESVREQSALHLLRRFIPYLWPRDSLEFRARIILAFLLLMAAKAVGLALPFAYKAAIDGLTGATTATVGLAIAFVGAYAAGRLFSVLFENVRNAVYERVGQRAVKNLALDVFAHLHRLSLRYHLERRTGGLSRVIERGIKSIDTMLYFLLFNIFPTIIELLVVCIIFYTHFGWELVAVTLFFVAAYILSTKMITEWRTKLRRQMVDLDTNANSRAIDSLLNFETVKYFNNEAHELKGYAAAMQRYEDAAFKSESSIAVLNVVQALITNLLLGLAMAWVMWGHARGQFTVGDVVLVNTLLIQLFRPLDVLGWVYREIKQGLIDMEKMYEILDRDLEVKDAPGAPALMPRGGSITFQDVHFGYDPRREILHGISFEVPAGKTLAIVGPSGAGKSTIARILFRFYDIQSGAVLIDGQDIRNVTQASLRQAIGIVPQDTVLFNDTIRYNIGYGRPGASDEAIEGAATRAQIDGFVRKLPDGYASQVGERGLKLSGGEKQRVAIARTILKDPPILILDEATSALDSKTEQDIQAALQAVSENRTTLVIAHRLSTIVDADEIIVLQDGTIAERGRHGELLARGGIYAEMWARQQEAADAGSDAREAVAPPVAAEPARG